MTPLAVLSVDIGPDVLVQVVGDVDAANVGTLLGVLTDVFEAGGTGSVVVDCARWTFVDAAGLRALAWLGDSARERGRLACLRNMAPWMHRLVHVTGVDEHFELGMAGFADAGRG